ncbi:fungal hydrophobin-domain-containing protein [Desarmillaria tabescens]|uniref:Hydrophobin n=1 Tax=Armillaria tabescens TaxID=1929756 RepID=A0AA39JHF3_ARMTA|nr:fungal hydrophobin-domain-containing protein [Desarmillaria tabescens]KAK0442703.1 fungal hydrophobin-domain-containing protein [Desarmillaria tabescens]
MNGVKAPGASSQRQRGLCHWYRAMLCIYSERNDLSPSVTGLLGSLGVDISTLTGNIGLTCSTIAVIGPISVTQCNNQVVCCSNNTFNGVVALGCNPINTGL